MDNQIKFPELPEPCLVGPDGTPYYSATQTQAFAIRTVKTQPARQTVEAMAECLDMAHQELIEAGVIAASTPPMMLANAVIKYVADLKGAHAKASSGVPVAPSPANAESPQLVSARAAARVALSAYNEARFTNDHDKIGTAIGGIVSGISDIIKALEAEEATAPAAADKTGLPTRDLTKTAEQQGLFRKFHVTRVDGSDQPGGKHHGCFYYVLDVDHDRHAPAALRAYAVSCQDELPMLAEDIFARVGIPAPADANARTPFYRLIAKLTEMRKDHPDAYLKIEAIGGGWLVNAYSNCTPINKWLTSGLGATVEEACAAALNDYHPEVSK